MSAIMTSKIKMEITQPTWCIELPTTNVAVSFAKASIAEPGRCKWSDPRCFFDGLLTQDIKEHSGQEHFNSSKNI